MSDIFWGRLLFEVLFYLMLSSILDCLFLQVVFFLRSFSIWGCPIYDALFYLWPSSILGRLHCKQIFTPFNLGKIWPLLAEIFQFINIGGWMAGWVDGSSERIMPLCGPSCRLRLSRSSARLKFQNRPSVAIVWVVFYCPQPNPLLEVFPLASIGGYHPFFLPV